MSKHKFQPGQSSNPTGGPNEITPATLLRKTIANDMPDIINTLVELAWLAMCRPLSETLSAIMSIAKAFGFHTNQAALYPDRATERWMDDFQKSGGNRKFF